MSHHTEVEMAVTITDKELIAYLAEKVSILKVLQRENFPIRLIEIEADDDSGDEVTEITVTLRGGEDVEKEEE